MAGIPPLPPPIPPAQRVALRLLMPMALIFAGVALMLIAAVVDEVVQERHPWGGAAMAVGDVPGFPIEEALSVRVRRVPPEEFSSIAEFLEKNLGEKNLGPTWEEDRKALVAWEERTEYVVLADFSQEPQYEALLSAGRLPEPGKPEVLAGPLVRLDTFEMDGVTFRVTGRIAPRAPAFVDAYLLPDDPRWQNLFASDQSEPGWVVRNESNWLEHMVAQGQPESSHPEDNTTPLAAEAEPPLDTTSALHTLGDSLEAGLAMTDRTLTIIGILALGLVAWGSTLLTTRIAHWLHGRGDQQPFSGLFMPLLTAIVQRPKLWWGLHIANYGILLGLMGVSMAFPRMTANLSDWMALVFSEGDLSYVGAAYESRNILAAAGATFTHNFFTATVKVTILPSLVLLGWGLLKTAGSLALVGFIMSPLWVGTLSGYTYHSITMGIEIEAYLVATFAVTVYALRILQGLFSGDFGHQFIAGLRVVAGAVVASAFLLFLAACYEAATLITFRL